VVSILIGKAYSYLRWQLVLSWIDSKVSGLIIKWVWIDSISCLIEASARATIFKIVHLCASLVHKDTNVGDFLILVWCCSCYMHVLQIMWERNKRNPIPLWSVASLHLNVIYISGGENMILPFVAIVNVNIRLLFQVLHVLVTIFLCMICSPPFTIH